MTEATDPGEARLLRHWQAHLAHVLLSQDLAQAVQNLVLDGDYFFVSSKGPQQVH